MHPQIVYPKPTCLDMGAGFRRRPVRPPEFQDAGFSQKFDADTLFFDSFFEEAGNRVVLLAPPFLNLLPLIEKMKVVAFPSKKQCSFYIKNMDRHSQIWVSLPDGTTRISVRTELGHFDITPGVNYSDFFEDKRVLFTLSKNNRLEWIQDWLRYNRDIHGANAVLFYDNQSTEYSTEKLMDALAAINGYDRICVIAWPFKYGPQGFDSTSFWDSDYCQIGALQHARWRFLQRARSALNSDVDELVASSKGSRVFEAVERSWSGVIRFYGVWVHGFSDKGPPATNQSPIRYMAFDHYLRPPPKMRYRIIPIFQGECPPKWAVVPGRCPEDAQWTAHSINDWRGARRTSREFCYRHYREINDHWKYDRSERGLFDPKCYVYDEVMLANFGRVDWTS